MESVGLSDAAMADAAQRHSLLAPEVVCPFQVSFITIDREPAYIHATLQSFLESDPNAAYLLPINIMVGGRNADFVRRYEEAGIAKVFTLSEKDAQLLDNPPVAKEKTIHFRFNANYLRGLMVGADLHRPVVLFEDDLLFTRGWVKKMLDLVGQFDAKEDFAFTLYSTYPFDANKGDWGKLNPRGFFGTQGIYFSPGARKRIAAHLQLYGFKNPVRSADIQIKLHCIYKGLTLYGTTRSLIQHVGMKTTGLSPTLEHCHQSPTFVP